MQEKRHTDHIHIDVSHVFVPTHVSHAVMTRLDDVVIGVSYAVLTTIFIVAYGVIMKVCLFNFLARITSQ